MFVLKGPFQSIQCHLFLIQESHTTLPSDCSSVLNCTKCPARTHNSLSYILTCIICLPTCSVFIPCSFSQACLSSQPKPDLHLYLDLQLNLNLLLCPDFLFQSVFSCAVSCATVGFFWLRLIMSFLRSMYGHSSSMIRWRMTSSPVKRQGFASGWVT